MAGLGLAMTVIKVKTCTTEKHLRALGRYLSPEKDKVVAHGSQFLTRSNWQSEMMSTLRAYGYDKPARAGASVAYARHVVIAFNPDECQKGGRITPEVAAAYTREALEKRWPNQEAAWTIHRETSVDGVSRYAAHIALGNVDLETGKRLNEGIGRKAATAHARLVKELDEEYGLRQLVAGERNVACHSRAETKKEQAMRARGAIPEKDTLRSAIRDHVRQMRKEGFRGNGMRELAKRLHEASGIRMSLSSGGKRLAFENEATGFKCGGSKLGRGFSASGIEKAVAPQAQLQISQARDLELER